jgi:hypothetical protein
MEFTCSQLELWAVTAAPLDIIVIFALPSALLLQPFKFNWKL